MYAQESITYQLPSVSACESAVPATERKPLDYLKQQNKRDL